LSDDFPILLIGASGNFGKRLARLLAKERGFRLMLAGRREAPLRTLAAELGGHAEVLALDRAVITPLALRNLGASLVIDASGPFQLMQPTVIEAAIGAGVHYVDLADGREFVRGITAFDDRAKAAGIAVISGASSTPALSTAVAAALTDNWTRVDTIRTVISPSNRQPRGRAVVEAILAGTGQPLRVLRDGRRGTAYGWGSLKRINLPSVGRRWASLCDTPDHDLMADRFRPRVAAEFYASLELSVMHLGLWGLGGLVRGRIVKSLFPLAAPLNWMADRLVWFGNDMGGMVVEAAGQDHAGQPRRRRWWLAAKGDIGPNVPVLAALGIARKLRDGTFGFAGAAPCVGQLGLADFARDFEALGMTTGTDEDAAPKPIFEIALGKVFNGLPPVTQSIHRPAPVHLWRGEGTAEGAESKAGRLIARLFRLPKEHQKAPLHVIIEQQADGSEHWSRVWPDAIMRSVMCAPGKGNGRIEEHFGPFAFGLQLKAGSNGMNMKLERARLFGVPLPKAVLPQIVASERVADQRHLFDVSITLPWVGRLVRYHGWLEDDVG
jgi:hypothetical protein